MMGMGPLMSIAVSKTIPFLTLRRRIGQWIGQALVLVVGREEVRGCVLRLRQLPSIDSFSGASEESEVKAPDE